MGQSPRGGRAIPAGAESLGTLWHIFCAKLDLENHSSWGNGCTLTIPPRGMVQAGPEKLQSAFPAHPQAPKRRQIGAKGLTEIKEQLFLDPWHPWGPQKAPSNKPKERHLAAQQTVSTKGVNKLCQQHVSTNSINKMCQQMCQHKVTTNRVNKRCQRIVSTKCVRQQTASTNCVNELCQQTV